MVMAQQIIAADAPTGITELEHCAAARGSMKPSKQHTTY
jgi:hypothetical protein